MLKWNKFIKPRFLFTCCRGSFSSFPGSQSSLHSTSFHFLLLKPMSNVALTLCLWMLYKNKQKIVLRQYFPWKYFCSKHKTSGLDCKGLAFNVVEPSRTWLYNLLSKKPVDFPEELITCVLCHHILGSSCSWCHVSQSHKQDKVYSGQLQIFPSSQIFPLFVLFHFWQQ